MKTEKSPDSGLSMICLGLASATTTTTKLRPDKEHKTQETKETVNYADLGVGCALLKPLYVYC